jgi:hypothetical protein
MKMKRWMISLVLLASLALAAIPFTGCKTVTNEDGTTVKVPNTNVVLQIAVIFRGAARNSALMAIGEDQNLKQWFGMAQVTIGQFVEGAVHDPVAFKEAIGRLPILSDKWARLIVGTVVDAYELYYLNYAAPLNQKSDVTWVACTFLAAIQDGFIDATSGRAMVSGQVKTLTDAKFDLQVKIATKKK